MGQFSTILFDADDTLFDYAGCEARALEETFTLYGLPCGEETISCYSVNNKELWKRHERGEITKTFLQKQRFALLFDTLSIPLDPDEFGGLYLRALGEQRLLVEDAARICQILSRKLALYLVTNGIASVQRARVANSAIQPYFNDIFISEEIGFTKPHKYFFDHVLSRIEEQNRDAILIVGDSLSTDIQGGLDAGIVTCWFNPTIHETNQHCVPHYEIFQLQELIEIVEITI